MVEVSSEAGAAQRQVASPFKFSRTPPAYRFAGAGMGAHTDKVLDELGYDAERIAALKKAGVVV